VALVIVGLGFEALAFLRRRKNRTARAAAGATSLEFADTAAR
jgi:hypothetical protein